MHKNTLFLLFLFPFLVVAQQINRVQVQGQITGPIGEDVEGISIYNISSQKGTITNENGEFTIEVGLHDRVMFTALQFQNFTVIIEEIILESKHMKIVVNPAIVQLDEIIVRPHDLTGNIAVDVSRIKTKDLNFMLKASYKELEYDYEFAADKSTGVTNSSLDNTSKIATEDINGINIIGLMGWIGETLFKNRKSSTERRSPLEKAQFSDASFTAIYQRFPNSYFTKVLLIPDKQITNFIYYIIENGFTAELLKENNELKLMNFLEKQSKIYLATTQ